jgi:hypothetical protein
MNGAPPLGPIPAGAGRAPHPGPALLVLEDGTAFRGTVHRRAGHRDR